MVCTVSPVPSVSRMMPAVVSMMMSPVTAVRAAVQVTQVMMVMQSMVSTVSTVVVSTKVPTAQVLVTSVSPRLVMVPRLDPAAAPVVTVRMVSVVLGPVVAMLP